MNNRYLVSASTGTVDIFVDPQLCNGMGSDNREISALLISSWTALLSDSPLGLKPAAALLEFRQELLDKSPTLIVDRFTTLADELISGLIHDESGFKTKTWLGAEIKHDAPYIFREYHAWYHYGGDPRLLRWLLSFLLYGKKLDYIDGNMDAAAFRSWLEVEESLADRWSFRSFKRSQNRRLRCGAPYPRHSLLAEIRLGEGLGGAHKAHGRQNKSPRARRQDKVHAENFTKALSIRRILRDHSAE